MTATPQRVAGSVDIPEQSAPATPDSGWGRLYVNTSGEVLFINDAGTTFNLSAMIPKSVITGSNVLVIGTAAGTPAEKFIAAGTIVGRTAAGAIDDLSASEAKTILAITESDVSGLVADLAGKIDESTLDINSVLVGVDGGGFGVPAALTMGASTILARLASGNIVAATPSQLRTLLSLVVGTDVQAYDAELAALAGLTSAANKIIRFTGSGTAGLLDFVDEDNMSSDSATALPSQQSVKAYADLKVAKATFPIVLSYALSDETTAITTGTAKLTVRAPYAFTLTGVRASLTTASTSGIPTVDINEGGSTILSTKLTIDANEKTSTTAATPAVISDSAIADDAELTFDIDVAGTGAKGLKVVLLGTRSV